MTLVPVRKNFSASKSLSTTSPQFMRPELVPYLLCIRGSIVTRWNIVLLLNVTVVRSRPPRLVLMIMAPLAASLP